MKENNEAHGKVVIVLPESKLPEIKRATIFFLGVSATLMVTIFINLNENIGLFVALGIITFLFIFDDGFRRRF